MLVSNSNNNYIRHQFLLEILLYFDNHVMRFVDLFFLDADRRVQQHPNHIDLNQKKEYRFEGYCPYKIRKLQPNVIVMWWWGEMSRALSLDVSIWNLLYFGNRWLEIDQFFAKSAENRFTQKANAINSFYSTSLAITTSTIGANPCTVIKDQSQCFFKLISLKTHVYKQISPALTYWIQIIFTEFHIKHHLHVVIR